MTEYTLDDLNILEEDSKPDDPNMFVPKFEIPGEVYNQDYPKRTTHAFPDNGKWTKKIEFQGRQVVRWKKKIFQKFLQDV